MAGGDAAEVLETGECSLDDVSHPVGFAVESVKVFARGIVGDDGRRSPCRQCSADCIAVIGCISEAKAGRHLADEFKRHRCIAAMAGPYNQLPGPALFIDSRVDLGGSPAA